MDARTSMLAVGLAAVMALIPCASAPCMAQQADEEGWVSLMPAQDLDGWKLRHEGGPNGWSFADGILSNTTPSTDIVTEIPFTDNELHVEFRVPPGGNSGVYLQGRYEVQVMDSAGQDLSNTMCGAIYGKIAPTENASKPAGEWQTFDITFIAGRTDRDGNVAQNARITVVQNGTKIIDDAELDGVTGGALDDQIGKPGPLMLQGDHTAIEYRNIRYRPLRVGWPDEALFTPLFDGKTLDGWYTVKTGHGTGGKWEVQDGVITGTQDPPGNGGLLLTRGVYGDFEVRCEINPEWNIDSGLFLRCDEAGRCYQVTVDYRPGGEVGTLYGEGIGGWLQQNPLWEKFYRRGEWNEIRAAMTGQPPHVQVWLNGNLTVDYWDTEERLPAEGHIALQVHGGGDWQGRVTRFRNIRVLPLKEQ
jgi:hypothetical protein